VNLIYGKRIKRILDIVFSLVLIVMLSPILATVALLVTSKLGIPVLFRQDRPGMGGDVFTLYKFRTMTDKRGADGELLPDEDRLTGFGKALRKTSLDELTELANILKGDMSFIGPRPLLVRYLSRYTAEQARRHDIRPGLTGWAQANGRNAISWKQKFEYDVWYVDNLSFALDMRIIAMTIKTILLREGISESGEATMSEFMGDE
jgi:lipopolysaccharide/colanic/teichoic acid biosynthesis glycosyltransferase